MDTELQGTPETPSPPRIPGGVWVLGGVSLLMDVSSEMIHALLPLFLVTTLGAGALAVGLVEGLAESTALIVKVFSATTTKLPCAKRAGKRSSWPSSSSTPTSPSP